MKILICSAFEAVKYAKEYGSDFGFISIMCDRDKKRLIDDYSIDIDKEFENRANVLRLSFDDVDLQRPDAPKMMDVKEAIRFAKSYKKLIVHCMAGVSRSSALAYVIACSQMPVDHAMQIVNLKVHCPNMAIVRMGSELLGNKKMLKKLEREEKRTRAEWMQLK